MSLTNQFTHNSCVTQNKCVNLSFIREKLREFNSKEFSSLMHTYTLTYTSTLIERFLSLTRNQGLLIKNLYYRRNRGLKVSFQVEVES